MDNKIKENANVSLHDCWTNKIVKDGESITFYLPNGFYIIEDSVNNNNYNAEVKCHLIDKSEDNISVYVYHKNIFGKTIREDYTDKFISEINEGKYEFEFVYTYRSYQKILFKGYIWQDEKPYHKECEIEILTDEITYSWTNN